MFQRLHQNPTLAGWRSVDGVVFQKVVPAARWGDFPKVGAGAVPESSMGWCSKSWGGFPKSCPRMGWCSKSWCGVPKGCSRIPTARWGGVPKLGWCSKKLSQNPHSVYYLVIFSLFSRSIVTVSDDSLVGPLSATPDTSLQPRM